MKHIRRSIRLLGPSALIIGGLAFPAWAAEDTGNWRGTYDLIMMWVNFGILAFIIVKFGRKPLMDFLYSQRAQVAEEIGRLEEEKSRMTDKINKTFKILDESDAHFEKIKERIVEEGEKRKQEIIDEANEQSRMIIEMSKQKVGNKIYRARENFRAELVDLAMELAMKRIPGEITQEDNERLIEEYISAAG